MSPLTQAILTWNAGLRIRTDLAMKLAAQGFDVTALEERHLAQ